MSMRWLAERFTERRLARPHLEISDRALNVYEHGQSELPFIAIPVTNRFGITLEQVNASMVLSRRNPDAEIKISPCVVYFVDNRRGAKIKGTLGTLKDGDTARVITSVYEDADCSYALSRELERIALSEGSWICKLTVFSAGKRIGKRLFKTKLMYPGFPLFTEDRSTLGRFFFP